MQAVLGILVCLAGLALVNVVAPAAVSVRWHNTLIFAGLLPGWFVLDWRQKSIRTFACGPLLAVVWAALNDSLQATTNSALYVWAANIAIATVFVLWALRRRQAETA